MNWLIVDIQMFMNFKSRNYDCLWYVVKKNILNICRNGEYWVILQQETGERPFPREGQGKAANGGLLRGVAHVVSRNLDEEVLGR